MVQQRYLEASWGTQTSGPCNTPAAAQHSRPANLLVQQHLKVVCKHTTLRILPSNPRPCTQTSHMTHHSLPGAVASACSASTKSASCLAFGVGAWAVGGAACGRNAIMACPYAATSALTSPCTAGSAANASGVATASCRIGGLRLQGQQRFRQLLGQGLRSGAAVRRELPAGLYEQDQLGARDQQ